jgi:hypothetical protein
MQDTNLECLEEWESSEYDSDGGSAVGDGLAGRNGGSGGEPNSRASSRSFSASDTSDDSDAVSLTDTESDASSRYDAMGCWSTQAMTGL